MGGGRRKVKRKGAVVRNMDGNAKYPILLLISQWEGGGGRGRGGVGGGGYEYPGTGAESNHPI